MPPKFPVILPSFYMQGIANRYKGYVALFSIVTVFFEELGNTALIVLVRILFL